MRPALTTQQDAILRYLHRQIAQDGLPPTGQELANAFGFASVNAARSHLQALARKGYLELRSGSARGIRLLDEVEREPVEKAAFEMPARSGLALPLIGRIAAGQPLLAEQHVDEWLDCPAAMFRPRADFLHRVQGQSMYEAGIHDGDLVAIHAQADADAGQIVAALLPDKYGEDRITLKRYFRRGRQVRLVSENSAPEYTPIEIELPEWRDESQERPPFAIAGVYVGLLRFSAR